MKPDKTPEADLLRILIAATQLARKTGTAEDAQVAARYEARLTKRLNKITQ